MVRVTWRRGAAACHVVNAKAAHPSTIERMYTMATKSKSVVSGVAQVRSMLEAACAGFNRISAAQAELNGKRDGNYSGTIKAAMAAGSAEVFSATWESLKADIATNASGIARKLGCGIGKGGKAKDGTVTPAPYLVPGSLKVAVSVILGAMAYGIALSEGGEPRSFGQIRKDKASADKAARESTETPLDAAQRKVRELCAAIAEGASALTVTEASEAAKILANVLKLETGAKDAPEKAERKAA